jgi:hypothetical protein
MCVLKHAAVAAAFISVFGHIASPQRSRRGCEPQLFCLVTEAKRPPCTEVRTPGNRAHGTPWNRRAPERDAGTYRQSRVTQGVVPTVADGVKNPCKPPAWDAASLRGKAGVLSAVVSTVTGVSDQSRELYHFELEPEVRDWLDSLSDSDFKRVDEVCGLLADEGTGLGGPWSDHLEGPVWELRVRLHQMAVRVTYWCRPDGTIVLLMVFRKTRQHDQRQIDRGSPGAAGLRA